MHLVVDAHNLRTDRRGIGVYLRAVLSRVLTHAQWRVTLLVRHPFPAFEHGVLARELQHDGFRTSNRVPRDADVVWHPWNGTFFPGGRRSVVTVHDVVPFALPASDARARESQQAPFERSARTATRIMADSAFTKAEIERYLRVEAERIEVVPLAVDERYTPGSPRSLPAQLARKRYVLYVGAIEERKNTQVLVDAWRDAFAARDVALAMVTGGPVPDGVVALRALGLEALRDLYRGALCVAMPSLYEGFGLPPLEGMACGVPAIVSRCASLPEVCGDAALYVDDPRSVAAWSAALARVAGDVRLREDLAARSIVQAARFSWDRTTELAMRVLREAAA